MESIFGIRRRTRRLLRAGLETLRDVVDARLRRIDEKRQRLAARGRETSPAAGASPAPRRRGRPRKLATQ